MMQHYRPHIEITPDRALAGERISVRLHGFEPGQSVTVRARMRDDLDRLWLSHATFQVDAKGQVDTGAQAPVSGSYSGADGMGLIWSMSLDPAEGEISRFMKRGLNPILITFTAEVDYEPVASGTLERLYISAGVMRAPVRDNHLVATLFRPEGSERRTGVIVLGGADGGMYDGVAARLASYGYPALSLAYFGMEHLAPHLRNVPLEYFKGAVAWMAAQLYAAPGGVVLVGWSRGGEAALLCGSLFPQVRGVVAYVPSGYAMVSSTKGVPDLTDMAPAWSYGGRPLPFLAPEAGSEVRAQIEAGGPVSLRPAFEAAAKADESWAAIAVEKIGGPVLLISGEDDAMWPSSLFSRQVMERLERNGHPHERLHLSYPQAGHTIGVPYRPTTVTQHRTPAGVLLEYGGTAAGNAHAEADSWPRVMEFLANVGTED